MVESAERIAKFAAAINADADECRKKIEAELQSAAASVLEKSRAEQEAHAKREIKLEASRLKDASNRRLSEKAAEKRAVLTEKRAKITREVFEKANKKLAAFTKTPEYDEFLEKSLKSFAEIFESGNLTVYVKEEDLNKQLLIESILGAECAVRSDSSIKTGGFKAENEEKTLLVDDTLDSRLSSQYEWFLENCGLSVIL